MRLDLAKSARAGAIALGLLGGLTVPSLAGPAGLAGSTDIGSSARSALTPLLVQSTEPDYRNGNDGQEWGNGWDDEWRRRRAWRRHGPDTNWVPRHRYPRSGIYFNFDLTPRYVEPRYVYPRRAYRGLSQAHINWCYNRYRSYRAWDNSFQPYGGPRQQCWSPYS